MTKKLETKTKYLEYLNSPEWAELRAKAYERAGDMCELCGHSAGAVHHIEYPKNLDDDELSNLLVVCELCHDKLHGKQLSKKHVAHGGNEAVRVLRQAWTEADDRYCHITVLLDELKELDNDDCEIENTRAFMLFRSEQKMLNKIQKVIEKTGAV